MLVSYLSGEPCEASPSERTSLTVQLHCDPVEKQPKVKEYALKAGCHMQLSLLGAAGCPTVAQAVAHQ